MQETKKNKEPEKKPDTRSQAPAGGRKNRFRPGLSYRLIFLWIVVLDSLLIYSGHYDPYQRFMNFTSLLDNTEPAPVFWAVFAADLLSLALFARIMIAVMPAAANHRRWVSGLIGMPILILATIFLERSFLLLLENVANDAELLSRMNELILAGVLEAAAIAVFSALSRSEGSGKSFRRIFSIFIRTFLLALLLGPLIFALRKLSLAVMILPIAGPPLQAGISLWVTIWFFRTLSLMVKTDQEIADPIRPPLTVAMLGGFMTFFLVGLSIIFPGPSHHLDAEQAPPVILHDSRVSPTGYDDRRQNTVQVSSRQLEVAISRSPFSLAVSGRDGKELLKLCTDENKSADYRGVALNREIRALRSFPFLGPDMLYGSRIRLNSMLMEYALDVRTSSGEVIAETRAGNRPMAVSFTFYQDDILKLTVDAGSRSMFYSTSIAFECSPDDRFAGLGAISSAASHRGFDLDLALGYGNAKGPRKRPSILSRLTRGRLSFTMGQKSAWPAPFVLVSDRVGVLLAETNDPRIELASRYPDAIRFSGRGGPLNLYIIAGDNPLDIARKMRELTGPRAEVPASVIMPWATVGGRPEKCEQNINQVITALRKAGIPSEFVSVSAETLGNAGGPENAGCLGLESVLQKGQELGFKFAFQDTAWVGVDTPKYDQAAENGYLVVNRMGLPCHYLAPGGSRAIIDYTNPEAVKWRTKQWKNMMDAGFSAVILDDQCMIPPDSVLYSGDSGQAMRNLFPLIYAQAVKSALGKDVIVCSHTGFSGMERFVSLVWPKGSESSPQKISLTRQVSQMINLAISGAPLAGPAPVADKNEASKMTAAGLYGQISLASVSPLFVLPEGIGQGQSQADRELQKLVRDLAETHVRLFPYLYSLARQQEREGIPMVRNPLWDLSDSRPVTDELLLGESLLAVIPQEAGTESSKVYFPPGKWLHLESLAFYEGGEREVPGVRGARKPLLFLSEGGILPLFQEAFHTFANAEHKTVVSGAVDMDITLMWISTAPAAITLFDDARATARQAGETILLRGSGGTDRSYTWRLFECELPVVIYSGGIRLDDSQWEYQKRSKILTIPDIPGPRIEIEVVLKAPPG